jgi:mRNA interferase MazF
MATRRAYVPDAGDIVWLQFDPQAGHEQAGHRPALVLSPAIYNSKAQLMVCCPLSTKVKNHPFEVQLTMNGIEGVVLSDQVKSLHWKVCKAIKKDQAPDAVMREVKAKIRALLAIS